jgi:hypothetical protein
VSEREFIVIASGHGSRERPNYPPSLTLQTRQEAEADAEHWVRHADTIGGTASVVRAVDYIAELHRELTQLRAGDGTRYELTDAGRAALGGAE